MSKKKNQIELDIDLAVEELLKAVDAIPEEPEPIGGVKLTREEQMERYVEIREDAKAWEQMLHDKPWDEVVDYARRMERRYQKEKEENLIPTGPPTGLFAEE